jgi:chemotaxis protein histidine kinase CheA
MVTPVDKTPSPPRTAAQEQAAQSRAKWAIENEKERRALQRQRSQLEMQREAEAEQQAMFDAERSARLKMEREEAMRAEMDEDDRRKAIEQEHARKLAAERAAEEQRRRDEVAQKKAMEAQRRREEVAARIKREKEAEQRRERLAQEKQKEEEAALAAKREIQQQFTKLRHSGSVMLTGMLETHLLPFGTVWVLTMASSGNVTTQAHDSLVRVALSPLCSPLMLYISSIGDADISSCLLRDSLSINPRMYALISTLNALSSFMKLICRHWQIDSSSCLSRAWHEQLPKSTTNYKASRTRSLSSSMMARCNCSSVIRKTTRRFLYQLYCK